MRTRLLAEALLLALILFAAALTPRVSAQTIGASAQDAEEAKAKLEANLKLAEDLRELVRGWLAYSKTTDEKHFRMSPFMSAPRGAGGEMSIHPVLYKGNVLKMNRPINQIDFGLDMDKGSANRADPNFLNMGFSFRKIIPIQRAKALRLIHASRDLEEGVRKAGDVNSLSAADAVRLNTNFSVALDESKDFRQNFFRALAITPFSPRLEMNLKALRPGPVINFVNNTEFQLRTGTREMMMPHLFWSLKLTPLAFESGVALRNTDLPLRKGQGLLRLNTGFNAKIALRFPCRTDLLANRIQFEVKAFNRHLLREESAFDRTRKRNDAIVRGNRYSIQSDFKYVFGFVTPIPRFKRRPTLVVTYKNGFFPPVYIFNNAVSFHFTLESDDNDNVSDISVR